MKLDIIGAGIGGLTTGIALKQKGINVILYDQSKEIKPVGAGIILANNAMQVFEKLGLREEIERKSHVISSMNLTEPDLQPISVIDLKYFEEKHKVKNVAIHRGVLQQILADKLSVDEVKLDHKLNNARKTSNGYELIFDSREPVSSSVLIAADGLNSIIRKDLFHYDKIRSANQICWRGVVDYKLPDQYSHELNEAWGNGNRFGFVQINENQVYWYALKSIIDGVAYSVDQLQNYFRDYHAIIKDLINATSLESIHSAEISDLNPTKVWHQRNLCMIGDAAHATTPNMGQGACQAIEDAYVLSECLAKYEINMAFETFQRIRMTKAHSVVKASWIVGKMAHIDNPFIMKLRNQLMRMIPKSLSRKQSEKIFQLANV